MAAVLRDGTHRQLWTPCPATMRSLLRPAHAIRAHLLLALSANEDASSPDQPRERETERQESFTEAPTNEDQAFVALFARYQLPLLDYLYGMTRDHELAADLVQETFLKAYASGEDLTQIEHPHAWLYRIATNGALNALRRRRRFLWIPLSHLEPDLLASSADAPALPAIPSPQPLACREDIAATVAERELVWQVLAELPACWRAVLLLQTTAGFTVAEIAGLLALTPANTRKILYRAKERFAKERFRELHARPDAMDEPPDDPATHGEAKTGDC